MYGVGIKIQIDGIDPITPVSFSFRAFECVYRSSWYRIRMMGFPAIPDMTVSLGNKPPVVRITWGISGKGEKYESTQKVLQLASIETAAQGGQSVIEIVATDYTTLLERQCSQGYYKEMSVSDIVADVVGSHGLDTEIDSTQTKYTLRQCRESDWVFLKDVVVPRAGPLPFLLYFRDGNVLMFKERKPTGTKVQFSYVGGGVPTGNIFNIASFRSQMVVNASNYPTKVVCFDKSKQSGNPYTRTYTASDGASPANSYNPFGGTKPPPLSDVPSKIESVIVEEGLNIDAEMRARTSWKAPFTTIRVAIPTMPMPQLIIGNTAALVNAQVGVSAPEHGFAYGEHLIYGLYHEIDQDRGQLGTTVFLERRGVSK